MGAISESLFKVSNAVDGNKFMSGDPSTSHFKRTPFPEESMKRLEGGSPLVGRACFCPCPLFKYAETISLDFASGEHSSNHFQDLK
jgi:hypothetical protein